MLRWLALSGLLACHVVACAPAPPPGQLTPTGRKAPPLEDAIRAARAGFYQAAAAGDARAMALLFAKDGMLITWGGDTGPGARGLQEFSRRTRLRSPVLVARPTPSVTGNPG
ncbi:MAG TPA: hypothetical protein VH137_09295 [Gemmatimonadales bacterium]|nr:hypothetical protein [Gemmatimonadales bacterium]